LQKSPAGGFNVNLPLIMNNIIGIRHEDKYLMERRVAIIPAHAKKLIEEQDLRILVQKSPKRVFTHDEFISAGAEVVDSLKEAPVIIGIKEIPEDFFEEGKTYIFFAHVIKGQPYNMPMLRKMIEKKVTLIDYEKVEDEVGKRLIFFGKYAGIAGMINSLWSLGQRLMEFGIETPFVKIKQSHHYSSLNEAIEVISGVGHEIIQKGLPKELTPLTIAFTGYGNVSLGAQEIAGLLPIKEITTEDLLTLKERGNLPNNVIYKVVLKEWDLSQPKDDLKEFDLGDYYAHPERYTSVFEPYIPHLTVLMNCMYWDDRYPRIVTKDYLEKLYGTGQPKLTVIGDVTCDPDGSIECTHKGTKIEDPVFVYDPLTRIPTMGFKGNGILVMAVDILPSELPRDASIGFSNALFKFIKPITSADYTKNFDEIDLPNPIKRAMILHKGQFTPKFKYIEQYL
jgi:alpha-aminoadipic semialdehyde synthase